MNKEIGSRIKKYRQKEKLSREALSKKIEVSIHTLSKYEQGQREPNIEMLIKIAEALGVTVNDLIGLNDEYSRATSLSDTYFNAVMKWSEDKSFNNIETICIREHFFDLLLRYKELINSLSQTKHTWSNVKESYSQIYKNRENPLSDNEIKELFLKQELENEINTLVNWINAFPNWMTRREIELSNNKD